MQRKIEVVFLITHGVDSVYSFSKYLACVFTFETKPRSIFNDSVKDILCCHGTEHLLGTYISTRQCKISIPS